MARRSLSADAVYDANGNLTSLSETTYGFRENPTRTAEGTSKVTNSGFAYAANGMQVGSTEITTSYDADGQQTSSTTIVHGPVYDGDAVVGYTETTSTYDGDDTLSSSSSTVRRQCQRSPVDWPAVRADTAA